MILSLFTEKPLTTGNMIQLQVNTAITLIITAALTIIGSV
jgi:hypothetical protein